MNYDQFRAIWHETLKDAGLLPFPPFPSETVELRWMSREYGISVSLRRIPRAGPFHVTARLSWKWNAAQAARTTTTEEDLLIEILGQDGYYLVTERPWLRVDITLRATLPMNSPLPMPDTDAWRHWTAEVTTRLAPLLPVMGMDADEIEPTTLSWRGEPSARLQCDPDGQLYLIGVELPAWQGIDLPRQWDNPDRPPDDWPDVQLANFAGRLHQALQEWEVCLDHLHREG
ncbi:MAG: hypothetical protein GY832_17635 [Chloroflexi bacterium]|nr:hypothetical protein [Chloroflexota bacterium]